MPRIISDKAFNEYMAYKSTGLSPQDVCALMVDPDPAPLPLPLNNPESICATLAEEAWSK